MIPYSRPSHYSRTRDSSSSHYYRYSSRDHQILGIPDQICCRVNTTSAAWRSTSSDSPARCGGTGTLRSPSQTTREATTCAPPDGPVTIAVEALLALAAWLDQRDEHGGDSCSPSPPNPSACPPAPVPAARPTDGDLGSTADRSPPPAATTPRRSSRPARDRRGGSAAGGTS